LRAGAKRGWALMGSAVLVRRFLLFISAPFQPSAPSLPACTSRSGGGAMFGSSSRAKWIPRRAIHAHPIY
jgi:hypothetical protein